MLLPLPRGPLSEWTVNRLTTRRESTPPLARSASPLDDDDLHVALWMAYELHFHGFDDVADDMEWDAPMLALRAELERVFFDGLRAALPPASTSPAGVARQLLDIVAADDAPSLARALRRDASREQFREFVAHRSVYHLKEADPHTFAIPRLVGPAKAAMIEIQSDEYGGGRYARMHSTLFANLMDELDMEHTYGRFVDAVPGITLATNNLMSLFGLHRRWRGAAAGHLACIEMTSSAPNRRYGQALRRLGGSERACMFFDEHVEADAVHEQIAAHDLCQSLVDDEPGLVDDVVFGVRSALLLDGLFAEHVLDSWRRGVSSLTTAPQSTCRVLRGAVA